MVIGKRPVQDMNKEILLSNIVEHKNIAIVGNALSLFNKNYGPEIDSCNIVCRINAGGLIIDTKQQGSKTDIWAYNTFGLITDSVYYKGDIFFIHLWRSRRQTKESKIFTDYFYSIHMLDLLINKLNSNNPSSGLMLIDLLCYFKPKSIKLFGFDWNETPTYYHDNNKRCHKYPHNFELERRFIQNNYIAKNLVTVME